VIREQGCIAARVSFFRYSACLVVLFLNSVTQRVLNLRNAVQPIVSKRCALIFGVSNLDSISIGVVGVAGFVVQRIGDGQQSPLIVVGEIHYIAAFVACADPTIKFVISILDEITFGISLLYQVVVLVIGVGGRI